MKIRVDSRKRIVDFSEIDPYFDSICVDLYLEIDGVVQTSFVDFICTLALTSGDGYVYTYSTRDAGELLRMAKNPFVSLTMDGLSTNNSYTLDVSVVDQDGEFTGSTEFVTPLPSAPFESWVYDYAIAQWVAPKELPGDGRPYIWNDSIGDWELAIFPFENTK